MRMSPYAYDEGFCGSVKYWNSVAEPLRSISIVDRMAFSFFYAVSEWR